MIKAIIVDDEPLARTIVKEYCSKISQLRILGDFGNALDAGMFLENEDVDLIFLDVNMPQLTGIEFIKSLSNPPKVVFTSAHPEHALEGFELAAEDYLLKPISFDRFYKAYQKVKQQLELERNVAIDEADDHFFIKVDKRLQKVFYDDIYYIEGLKDYVIIKLENERIVSLQTMKSLVEKLPSDMFLRVHRSYIINLHKIHAIYGNRIEMIVGKDNKNIPIGKNHKNEVLDLIKDKKF